MLLSSRYQCHKRAVAFVAPGFSPASFLFPTAPPQPLVPYFSGNPYCDEQISMVLDVSVRAQSYIEDCEVCCKPIQIIYSVRGDKITNFEAKAIQ
jgi:hypothetical protein